MLAGGGLFLIYYLYCYWRAAQDGYQVSAQKVVLLVSTGICFLVAWGFNPFGEAFLS